MAKNRTLNEIRQSKEFQQAKSTKEAIANQQAINRSLQTKEVYNLDLNVDVVKNKILESLQHQMYDIIFEAVNEEMHKFQVFQEDNYLTEAGIDMFEEHWFEFYHEHHGDIMHQLMSKFTN